MEVFVGFSTANDKSEMRLKIAREAESSRTLDPYRIESSNGEEQLSDAPDAGEFLVLY
jgi:hypothetical protein